MRATEAYLIQRFNDAELSDTNRQAIVNELVEKHGYESTETATEHILTAHGFEIARFTKAIEQEALPGYVLAEMQHGVECIDSAPHPFHAHLRICLFRGWNDCTPFVVWDVHTDGTCGAGSYCKTESEARDRFNARTGLKLSKAAEAYGKEG